MTKQDSIASIQNTPENIDRDGLVWTEREFSHPERTIRIGTSFSGVGAIEYAFKRLGLNSQILFAGDIDKNCKKSYFANYTINDEQWHTDIHDFDATPFRNKIDLLVGGAPCQAFSTVGGQLGFEDTRGTLFREFARLVKECKPKVFIFENVKGMLSHDKGRTWKVIKETFEKDCGYDVYFQVLNAKDYGISQSRPRAIIKLWRKGLSWPQPKSEPEISLKDAIGHLPSLEPGQDSGIPWHWAKKQNERAVLAMRHTASGKSAIANEVYYPKKKDGTRIKGLHNTYKRMVWDQPCPARTTYSGSISSHNNVHPGHKLADGTYSDPRVLTLLETFIVSSIPVDIKFPPEASESFIRTVIGEAIPPKLMKKIVELIGQK